ncbi:MAG: PAS domain S-box protein [Pararhodobacter sp.]|nr:PAS domain S-box protein [Pararhodobacter sp.]
MDGEIALVLTEIGSRLGAERLCVLLKDAGLWNCSHEWCAEGVSPVRDRLRELPLDADGFTPEALLNGQDVLLGDVAALPESPLRALLMSLEARCVAAVPMIRGGSFVGVIALSRHITDHPFEADLVARLHPIADGLYSAISHHRAEAALGRAREAQGEAVERLRATLAAMHDLVLEVNSEGRYIDIHSLHPDLLAAPADKTLGSLLEDVLSADIAALKRAAMAEALERGVSKPVEYWLETGGRRRRFRLRAARRATPRGETGFVLRIADITDEHEQKEQNELLGVVTRNMTNFVLVLDEAMRIRWANPAFEKSIGKPLSALIGRRIREFTGSKTSAQTMAAVDAAVAAREPVRVTGHRLAPNGSDIWIDISLQPWHDREGRFRGFLSVETDITEQKRHEDALAEMAGRAEAAHRRLTAAIEALDDGFVLFDAEDRLVLFNSRYRQINAAMADIIRPGVTMQEIIVTGVTRGIYMHTPDGAQRKQRALTNASSKSGFEDELVYADGRVIRVSATALADGGHVGLRTDITKLRQAEQRLADIITGARIGTWDLDLTADIEEVNDFWFQMLGYERSELPEHSKEKWAMLAHPEDNARINEELARIVAGEGDRLEIEARLRHRQGHWVHVLTRGHVTERDTEGRALRMSGIDIDITERRQAEERLSAILEGTMIATWEFDTAIPSTAIDDTFAAMLGRDLEELAPFSIERLFELIHPEDIDGVKRRVRAACERSEDTFPTEFRLHHKSGRWVWVMCKTWVRRWGNNGLAEAASGIMIDITEAKEREAALTRAKGALELALAERRAAEQRMADIAEISNDWFWEQDTEGRFTYVSQGFERTTGVPRSKLIGRRREEISNTGGEGEQWERLRQIQQARQSYSGFVYQMRSRDDGRPIHIRVSGTPYRDAEGHFAGYRGVGTDVTPLVRAVERAEAASESKSRFLANMSHELRTPLMGVLGMAELLAEGEISDEQRSMVETIRDSGEGLLSILNDLLDLAKIEAGKLEIQSRPFEPAALARRIEAHYRLRARSTGISLAVRTVGNGARKRMADPDRLLQILHNLVSNAIKFTKKGEVKLTIAIEGERLNIAVSDSGIGMSSDQVARVFDEFEQADSRTARRFGGTGLGLSITRRLVELMGGEIELDSLPGLGTTVRLTLPAPAAEGEEADAPAPENEEPAELSGLRILVADDNRTNRLILQRMLEGLGVAVTVCDDGKNVLKAFRPGEFDLLLLDIAMPGMDGPSALAAIRERERDAGAAPVPALAVTANAMRHQVEGYIAAGFAGHLPKPFRKAALAREIGHHARQDRRTAAG